MKALPFFVLIFFLAACSKQEEDCSQTTRCIRTYYTFSTCTDGVYEEVFEKTSISPEMSVCDTTEWLIETKQIEAEFYQNVDDIWKEFLNQYPSKCNCAN